MSLRLEVFLLQCQDYQNELSQSNAHHEENVLNLNTKLQEVTEQKDQANVVLEQLRGMITALETERHQHQMIWKCEKEELEQELQKTKQEVKWIHSACLKPARCLYKGRDKEKLYLRSTATKSMSSTLGANSYNELGYSVCRGQGDNPPFNVFKIKRKL